MSGFLGVTAPAVNKWENNNNLPDIALIAPIARLLGISTDTLLSFKDELTKDEINVFIKKLNQDLENGGYDAAFRSAQKRIFEFPNCEKLAWETSAILDSGRFMHDVADSDSYDSRLSIGTQWH